VVVADSSLFVPDSSLFPVAGVHETRPSGNAPQENRLFFDSTFRYPAMRLHHFALALACSLGLVGLATAGTVYEVNTVGATTVGSKNNGGVFIGQSFNSGTNTLLTAATLQINRNGLATANFTLTLHQTTGVAGDYMMTGPALGSLTMSNAALSETEQDFYPFSGLNWPLTPNTVYMIGINSENTATVKWTLNQSAVQTGSTGFITGYSGYNAQKGGGDDNGLHGATISAVPEPPTVALAAMAGIATWLVRFRKRSAPTDG
jgi:hypothetical protein